MITLFYILIIFFGSSHCDDLLSRIEVENSINRTINEVERLIRQNSTLPHLNRREIVDILVNITSKDLEAYEDKQKIEEARKIYQRALMVVLPYNAENAKESINDLYTKPPIVEIIADPLHNQENYETWKTAKLQSDKSTLYDEESIKNLVVAHTSERTTSKENPPEKIWYKNHKETYSEMNMNTKENLMFDSAPVKFSFNLENLQKQSMTTEEPIITTRQPVFVKSSNEDEDVDIIYSTSVTTMQSIVTSPKNALINSKESQTLFRPLKHNENVLSADQWRYHAPTVIAPSPMTSAKNPNSLKIPGKQPFSSIATFSSENIMAPTVINKIESASETEASEIMSEEMQIEDVEQTTPIYVTPISSTSSPFSPPEKSNYNSTYNLNLGGFRKITTTMRPEVMDLIASIGLRPENTIHIEKVFERNKEHFENKSQVLNSNGLIYTTTSSLTAGEPDSLSITGQNTFESSVSELGKGMNNLTPDIQLLFQRFGLQTSNLVTTTPKPTSISGPIVNANSYTNFKLLPTSNVKDQDMKEFLARFGLGVSDRHKKAMPVSTEHSSLIEAVPDNMKSILENIGLISRKATPKVERIVEPMKITKFHVFKPHEVIIKDEKQKMQINELLDTIRLVQEGKASAKDVRKVANDLLVTTKTLKDSNGPDPLSLEEIITIYNNDMKNEVKRQQNSQETVETNSDQDLANITAASTESIDVLSTTISTTTTMTTSDSAKDNSVFSDTSTSEGEREGEKESSTSADTNLVALQESFGTTRAPDPILSNKRKTGLYFLVDLNTFLEVGDENSEKVNLRFQPKVGDRTKFLRVSVP